MTLLQPPDTFGCRRRRNRARMSFPRISFTAWAAQLIVGSRTEGHGCARPFNPGVGASGSLECVCRLPDADYARHFLAFFDKVRLLFLAICSWRVRNLTRRLPLH